MAKNPPIEDPGNDPPPTLDDYKKNVTKHTAYTSGLDDFECIEYYDVPVGTQIQSVPSKPPPHMSTIDIVFIVLALVISCVFMYMIMRIFQNS
jgi:hypothetical protein